MLTNHLKIAFRALWRRKFTTGLNVIGLALGMTAFLFLMEFASFHAGFDNFHANADRLFRIVGTTPEGSQDNVSPMMLAMRSQVHGIEALPTFMTSASGIVTYKPDDVSGASQAVTFKEEEVAYSNNDVFRAFSFQFLAGNADLDKPNTMVITASAAQKYFACGENYQRVIGKRLLVANQFTPTEYAVTGVMRNIPENSHLRGTMFFSLQTLANPTNLGDNSWARLVPDNGSAFLTAYLLLRDGSTSGALEKQINDLSTKVAPSANVTWHLQPIRTIHTGNGLSDPLPNSAGLKYVVIAVSIALFVLSLAWINYINLSTAFGLSRAREIGVRKTIGATRGHLVMPHLLECALLSVAAFLLSLTAVELLQSSFNSLLGAELHLGYVFQYGIGIYGMAAMFLGALLSGSYVALVLTGVKPIIVLRGNFTRSANGRFVRKTLVVIQFAVSIAFIAGTFIILRQLDFMSHRELGMNLEQLLIIDGPQLVENNSLSGNPALVFKQEVERLPFVRQISGSQNIPGQGYNFSAQGIMRPSGHSNDAKQSYKILQADENYFTTYQMTFDQGKGFQKSDNLGGFKFRSVVLNEASVAQLGFKSSSDAVGQFIQWGNPSEKGQRLQICGVVKNYHHKSLHNAIEPIIFLPSAATGYFSLRVTTDNVQANMAALEALYKNTLPGNPFTARFADDIFQKQYENDVRVGNLFAVFSIMTVVIACLGLFGLTAFAAESRRKEIGVRKVLGATDASIIALLSTEFLKLVAIAFVIACPTAFWLMSAWLQDFAYHVELRSGFGALVFVSSGILAALIAFITIAAQARKTAQANAVESLRYE